MVTGPQNNTNGEHDHWIPDDDWRTIVANVPLVSVDLVIEHDGGVLLGKRENEPAKGGWFVLDCTVFKNEPRTDAVHRVAKAELGETVVIDECLDTYEYFYETADVDNVDSKHCLATSYRCHFKRDNITYSTYLIKNTRHSGVGGTSFPECCEEHLTRWGVGSLVHGSSTIPAVRSTPASVSLRIIRGPVDRSTGHSKRYCK